MMKIQLTKLTNNKKKYKAEFFDKKTKKKIKSISFGSSAMRDFTRINNPKSKFYIKEKAEREKVKQAYLDRHRARENWNNPMTAGALSRWLLWNKTTFNASLNDFKKMSCYI